MSTEDDDNQTEANDNSSSKPTMTVALARAAHLLLIAIAAALATVALALDSDSFENEAAFVFNPTGRSLQRDGPPGPTFNAINKKWKSKGTRRNCNGNWSSWSRCEETSLGAAQRCRTYTIATTARNGGTECRHDDGEVECDDRTCNKNCQGNWGEWGECQATSDGGAQRCRVFKVARATVGRGLECKHDDGAEECDNTGCGQDCEGYWGEWRKFGRLQRCRYFSVKTPALGGGSACAHVQDEEQCEIPIMTRVRTDLGIGEYKRNPQTYNDLFKEEVAASLGVDKDRVVIVHVYDDGSKIFEFYIENDPDLAVTESLRTKIEDGSVTISYAGALKAVVCKGDACEDGWGNVLIDPIEAIRNG